jgi:CRP/FNR family cyclic AMP-dependent transcriptional regulator
VITITTIGYNMFVNSHVQQKLLDFFEHYSNRSVSKNSIILFPDKEPEGVHFLRSGLVRMYGISKDGIEFSLNIFKPFSFFPMGWVFNDTQNPYFYESLEESNFFIAPKIETLHFLKENNDITIDLLERIYKGLDGYFLKTESLLTGNAHYKVITQLLIQTKRFGKITMTHNQLATLTGLSRETVSREIEKLIGKGLVLSKGRTLIIPEPKKLEAEFR